MEGLTEEQTDRFYFIGPFRPRKEKEKKYSFTLNLMLNKRYASRDLIILKRKYVHYVRYQ